MCEERIILAGGTGGSTKIDRLIVAMEKLATAMTSLTQKDGELSLFREEPDGAVFKRESQSKE